MAGLDAIDPCMIKVGVANISTPLEPRTAASATTELAGLLKAAALGACRFARPERFCGHADVN